MSLEDTDLESEKRTPRQAKCLACNLTQTWSRVSSWTSHLGPLRKVGYMTYKCGILSTNDHSLEPCLSTTPVVFSWETFGIDRGVGYGTGGLGCLCPGRRSRFAQRDCSALTEVHGRANHEVNPCCSDEQNQPSIHGLPTRFQTPAEASGEPGPLAGGSFLVWAVDELRKRNTFSF